MLDFEEVLDCGFVGEDPLIETLAFYVLIGLLIIGGFVLLYAFLNSCSKVLLISSSFNANKATLNNFSGFSNNLKNLDFPVAS